MRFNELIRGKNKTTNYEGAEAYRLSPEWELYTNLVYKMSYLNN